MSVGQTNDGTENLAMAKNNGIVSGIMDDVKKMHQNKKLARGAINKE